jgi:hypothetical protein
MCQGIHFLFREPNDCQRSQMVFMKMTPAQNPNKVFRKEFGSYLGKLVEVAETSKTRLGSI